MQIINFTPMASLFGGILIGLAAVILMLFNGKIAGISGITKGIFSNACATAPERLWRITFVLGLMVGGAFIVATIPSSTVVGKSLDISTMIIAGLLVGVGTAMGNGCTSGHGVCGLARRSRRSLTSVISFMTAGFVTMFIIQKFI